MALKVVFRNKFIPIVDAFLKKNPSIKVPHKQPYRDEEMEKIEALKNNVDRSFDELRKIRNDLQYDYTIAPKLCGDKLITMINLVEVLAKGSSKKFFTESKKLFSSNCFQPFQP